MSRSDAKLDKSAIFTARAAPDILAVLHEGLASRADKSPTETDVCDWLPKCPGQAVSEAGARLDALAGLNAETPAGWRWTVYRPQPGMAVPHDPARDGQPISAPALVAAAPSQAGFATLAAVHVHWCQTFQAQQHDVQHPLAPVIEAWIARPRAGDQRRLDYVQARGLRLSKVPALANVAAQAPLIAGELLTVEVDGEPFVSPGPVSMRRYRPRRTKGQMDAFPATIDSRATGNLIVQALADAPLTGDERSTLRRDLRAFGETVFALAGPIEATAGELIEHNGWAGIPASNLPRLSRLLRAARFIEFDMGDGLPRWLFDLNASDRGWGLDTRFEIAAGKWWQGGAQGPAINGWRLSGGLWRPAVGDGTTGLPVGYWGLADRIVAGIESALTWGPSAGKGRGGRVPDALKPIRRGGPGPERFIPAWHVLRLGGEHVTAEEYRDNPAPRHRYKSAVDSLDKLGYFCPSPSVSAPAGGTVEVTKRQRPGRGRPAGLMVRATARFCAAYAKGQRGRGTWSSVPLANVQRR